MRTTAAPESGARRPTPGDARPPLPEPRSRKEVIAMRAMTVDEGLRAVAGTFVVLSVALGTWVNPWFFAFTAFVGLNLFQSAFTRWCPMMAILKRLGFVPGTASCS